MAILRPSAMLRLARWHIWLGWLAGVPLVIWTLSGLFMAARPIEEVRGEHLRAPAEAIAPGAIDFPQLKKPVVKAELIQQGGAPVWVVTGTDGSRQRYFGRDGSLLPPVLEDEAREIAAAAYAGSAKLASFRYFPDGEPPGDLRGAPAVWQAHYTDGTNLYVEARTGTVLAVRTGWWRIYDFMWGLHIMDLTTREDTSHPILILFATLAVISSSLGTVLLFRRRKAKRPA